MHACVPALPPPSPTSSPPPFILHDDRSNVLSLSVERRCSLTCTALTWTPVSGRTLTTSDQNVSLTRSGTSSTENGSCPFRSVSYWWHEYSDIDQPDHYASNKPRDHATGDRSARVVEGPDGQTERYSFLWRNFHSLFENGWSERETKTKPRSHSRNLGHKSLRMRKTPNSW